MSEFRVRVLAPAWIKVEHPSTGYIWHFGIDEAEDGRRTMSMRSATAVPAANGDMTQEAYAFAKGEAIRVGRVDG